MQTLFQWALRCPAGIDRRHLVLAQITSMSCHNFFSAVTRIDSLPRFEVLASFSKTNKQTNTNKKTRHVKLFEQRRDCSFIVLTLCACSRGNGAMILFVSKRFTLFHSFLRQLKSCDIWT